MVLWGSRAWQIMSAIFIIFILGYGTYTILMDIITGHPIWWYNSTFILFGFTLLGLLFLVREGWQAFNNIMMWGLHPKERESGSSQVESNLQQTIDESYTPSEVEEEGNN
ncbi:MAG: hypothetical protein ACFFF4_02630 [Candidatus Thorarchaeota archaeon]